MLARYDPLLFDSFYALFYPREAQSEFFLRTSSGGASPARGWLGRLTGVLRGGAWDNSTEGRFRKHVKAIKEEEACELIPYTG